MALRLKTGRASERRIEERQEAGTNERASALAAAAAQNSVFLLRLFKYAQWAAARQAGAHLLRLRGRPDSIMSDSLYGRKEVEWEGGLRLVAWTNISRPVMAVADRQTDRETAIQPDQDVDASSL